MATPNVQIDGVTYRPTTSTPERDGMPYVICRCTKAGVHAGYLESRNVEGYLTLRDARRVWYWSGAASLSELAVSGAKNVKDSKIAVPVDRQELLTSDVCEIIHTQAKGAAMLQGAPEWMA